MKTWFVLSASGWEHGHWGWRRHLYEVPAEVRSARRDNSVGGERRHPQWLLPGSLKNVVFVLSCLQSSSGEWLSRARKATSNRSAPTLTSLSTSSDPPRQLLLWRHSRGACSSRPGAIAGQLLERESIRQREGGILHLASGKQGRSHSYILINL